jgi:hypothetical protein
MSHEKTPKKIPQPGELPLEIVPTEKETEEKEKLQRERQIIDELLENNNHPSWKGWVNHNSSGNA